jgi:tRNA G18 (ribose-2'-O)-methylase SpoU
MLVDAKRTKPLPEIIDDSVPLFAAGPEVLQRITGYHLHRGVLACFKRRELLSFAEAIERSTTVAVIEGVNNPTNLGVILRCAIALGVDSYLLDPTCCDPLYRRCGRVSMGEAFATPYARLGPFPDGLGPLRDAGFELLALTPAADAVPINELKLGRDDRVALLLGAEGPGLTEASMAACDRRVKIPMSGTTDSINVGSAAAVAFYAVAQARTAAAAMSTEGPARP